MWMYAIRKVITLTLFFLNLTTSIRISRWNIRRPDDSIFLIYYELSYKECYDGCIRFSTCGVFDYNRRFQMCRISYWLRTANQTSIPTTGFVTSSKIPGIDHSSVDPVLDTSKISECLRFTRNVDDITIECKTTNGKKLFVRQPDGQITDHVTVFRAFNAHGIDTYDSWINRKNVTLLKTCVSPVTCDKHFRHLVVDKLGTKYVTKVKYVLRKVGEEVAYILFEGEGHDLESWFNRNGVINSSWSGLTAITDFNYFSLKGHDPGRRFFISVRYDKCPGDQLVTFATTNNRFNCDFDKINDAPQLSYCGKDVPCIGKDLKIADTLEIEWYY